MYYHHGSCVFGTLAFSARGTAPSSCRSATICLECRNEIRDGPVEFFFGGEMTEFPPASAVPAEAARDALHVFFETGELTPNLDWDET